MIIKYIKHHQTESSKHQWIGFKLGTGKAGSQCDFQVKLPMGIDVGRARCQAGSQDRKSDVSENGEPQHPMIYHSCVHHGTCDVLGAHPTFWGETTFHLGFSAFHKFKSGGPIWTISRKTPKVGNWSGKIHVPLSSMTLRRFHAAMVFKWMNMTFDDLLVVNGDFLWQALKLPEGIPLIFHEYPIESPISQNIPLIFQRNIPVNSINIFYESSEKKYPNNSHKYHRISHLVGGLNPSEKY